MPKDSVTTPFGALFVSDEHLLLIAKRIHYPEHWDTAAYPDLGYALCEMADNEQCSECNPCISHPEFLDGEKSDD